MCIRFCHGANAARQVARCVLKLGHRTAVFISPHRQAGYSRLRLDGMQRVFAEAENARLFPVSRPVIEIEGQIIPRRTTGRAREGAAADGC